MQGYPSDAPIINVNLPVPLEVPYSSSTSSSSAASSPLTLHFAHFLSLLSTLQPFWSVLDDMKRNAWILEPEAPVPMGARVWKIAIGEERRTG